MPFYEWQRPSYKKVLEERQAVLRQYRLDEDAGLLAEWFALVAELDRCLREEHAQQDINPYLASAYYKTVLLARQEQLRKADLSSDEVLLMEWCMLVRELDAIVQKEHIMEKTAEGQHAVKLLNEASSARRQQQQQEGPQHDAAEAASQTATAKREKKAPLPPRPAGLQDLPDFQIDGPTDVVYPAAAAAAAAEDDEVDEEEVSQWLQVEDAAAVEASTGGATPAKPKKMTIAEAAAAGLADPTFAVAAAIEAENAGAAMSLESYATLPPSEKLKALCTPSMVELDVDATSKSLQALSEWTPPTRTEVEEASLPSWLLGDDDEEDDEVDMLFGIRGGGGGDGGSGGGSNSGRRSSSSSSGVAGGGGAIRGDGSYSSNAGGGNPLDPRRITELELKRELARKDEELRLVEAQIDLEAARKCVEKKDFGVTHAKNSDEKANLQMELIEAQSELDWRQKECEAVQLKLELHEMERSLEGARLGVLAHPQVGELLDSSDILTRIANESAEPDAVLSIATAIESTAEDNGERGLVLASSNPILGLAETAAAHKAVVSDKVAVDDIEATLALIRTQATAAAARGGEVDPTWMEKQLATLSTSQLHRQGTHAKIKESLLKSAENKPLRVQLYMTKAAEELSRQILKAERRAVVAEQEMSAERKRQAQEHAEFAQEEEQKQARLRVMGEKDGRAENTDASVQRSKLKAAYWSAQVKVLETHIQKKAETMQRMNKFTLQATGKRAIATKRVVVDAGKEDGGEEDGEPDWL